jgi:hypothetical protein
MCVCVCVTRLFIHYPLICICKNRSGLCVLAPVCDGDGSAVCARVGGLVLRARPNPRNPKPCEPLPVGVDRVRLRRAGVLLGVGVQRQHRRVEHRVGVEHGLGMRRFRPRRRALCGGRARRVVDAARPVVRSGTADARARAHTCRHSLARGLWCRFGRAEGRLDTCIRIYVYIYVCACVCVFIHTLYNDMHLSVHVRIGRGYVCVHQFAMGDGSAVCARVGGLVLRARPKARNPKPCEPLPVGVDRVRLRRAGVQLCGFGARLYVRMRWLARAADSAVHCICSAPGAPSTSLPNLHIAMWVDL